MGIAQKFSDVGHEFYYRNHDNIVKFALVFAFIINHCPLKIRALMRAPKWSERVNRGHNLLEADTRCATINPDPSFIIAIVVIKGENRWKKRCAS